MSTPYSSEVEIRARRECANRFIGKTTELRDRRAVTEMLGDPKILDSLWDLEVGQFYVRGDALTTQLSKIQVDFSEIVKVEAGVQQVKKPEIKIIPTEINHMFKRNFLFSPYFTDGLLID